MKSLMKAENAGSMSILLIVSALFSFGMLFVLLSTTFNIPIEYMNNAILEGTISTDTKYYFNLCLDMWRASPFFLVIGLVLFCYERAKGTDLEVSTYFSYVFLMLITLIISTFLVYSFGLSVDGITSGLDISILTDVSETWGDTIEQRGLVVKMLYYFLMLPAVLGIILYVFHPIIKQKEVTVFQRDEQDNQPEIGFNLGQF